MIRRFWPVLLIITSIAVIQGSSSLVKTLFHLLGPEGLAAWRLLFSSIMLTLVFKPWRKPVSKQAWKFIIPYGLVLGFMNMSYYFSIERIPIGIAVSLELTGPIVVALFSAKKWSDYIWLVIMLIGLSMLLPIYEANADLDLVGVLFALGAGACWAMYIVFGRQAGKLHGPSSVAIGSILVTFIVFPIGIWQSGMAMFSMDVVPQAFLVAILASAIPYGLDMIALPKVSALTFSTLMSLSPVIAALSGFIFLHEKLTYLQWLAMLCIMTSSIGVVLSINRSNTKTTEVKRHPSTNDSGTLKND